MNIVFLSVSCLTAFAASVFLAGLIRHYSGKLGLIDAPGERSSHFVPTPRGGGLAFVLVFMVFGIVTAQIGLLDSQSLIGIFGAGFVVAVVGLVDDFKGLSVRLRLLAHLIAAMWGAYWLHGLPAVAIAGYILDFSGLEYLLAVLYLVWLLNLYNFMDGIDGIASVEAITVLSGFCVVTFFSAQDIMLLPAVLAAAVSGFLCWNFPPAKIFMGDVGSGFLGMVIGLLSMQTSASDPGMFWVWLILLGVFVVDASVTLVRRMMRKQKIYQAHRSHAYQYASRLYKSHKYVTLTVAGINIFLLWPIALLVSRGYLPGVYGVLIAYVPLVLMAVYFKAGASDLQRELA